MHLKAQDAYDLSMAHLDSIDVEAELKAIYERIHLAASIGMLATASEPIDVMKAEKIGIHLEEEGYFTATQPANVIRDQKHQSILYVNWKNLAARSRERLK